MSWGCLPKNVTRMDAGAEPPGMVLWRALDYMAAGIPNSCLDQSEITFKHTTMWLKHKIVSFNGDSNDLSYFFGLEHNKNPTRPETNNHRATGTGTGLITILSKTKL